MNAVKKVPNGDDVRVAKRRNGAKSEMIIYLLNNKIPGNLRGAA